MAPDPIGDPTTFEAMQLSGPNHCICAVYFGVIGRFQLIFNLQQGSRCCSRLGLLPSARAAVGNYAPAFRPPAMAPDPIGDPTTRSTMQLFDPTTCEAMQLFGHNHCLCAVDCGVIYRFQLVLNLVSRCCSRPGSLPSARVAVGNYPSG